MRTFIKWSLSALLVTASVFGVLSLPEYMALQTDHEYVNQFRLYEQNTSNEVYMDLDLSERLEILLLPDYSQGNNICVIETTESDVVLESNQSLFTEMKKQIERLEELHLTPVVSTQFDFQKHLERAELYALTSDQHPGKVLYVWKITFSNDNGAYSVTMDADTYKIYDFYASGFIVDAYMDFYNRRMETVGGEFYSLYKNWFDDYMTYLYDGNVVEDKEQEASDMEYQEQVQELKWGGTEAIGFVTTDSFAWNLHLFMEIESQIFHFRMSNEYGYDAATEAGSYVK